MKKKAKSRLCTIYYRRMDETPWDGPETLQNRIQAALSVDVEGAQLRDRFKKRIWHVDSNSLFINVYIDEKTHAEGAIFGDLTMFSAGRMQALIESESDAPTASVDHLSAPQKKEFISSIMYWMVRDNHVLILQSMAIRSDNVEDYFTWLLRERTSLMPKEKAIVLVNKFDQAKLQSGVGKPKGLTIGGSIRPLPVTTPDTGAAPKGVATRRELAQQKVTGWQQVKEILLTLTGSSASVEKVMTAIPQNTELSVQVHIGFKENRHKHTATPLSLLETGLRNMPDSFLQIEGEHGNKAADGSIRLHHKTNIEVYAKDDPSGKWLEGMLEYNSVLKGMKEAYNVLVETGKIKD